MAIRLSVDQAKVIGEDLARIRTFEDRARMAALDLDTSAVMESTLAIYHICNAIHSRVYDWKLF